MKFFVIVNAAPETDTSVSALAFCQSIIESGHEITRVFFLGPGVRTASSLYNPSEAWHIFVNRYHIDAVCCSDSVKQFLENTNDCQFTIAGMGQLVDATQASDKVITFGQRK